jgi:penicillin-binding protein 1A
LRTAALPTGAKDAHLRSAMIKLCRFLFVCTVLAAIAGGVFAGLTVWYFGRDLPNYQQLANYQPPIMTRVQAGDGRLLAEYATERRVFVPISAIPKRVTEAFVAAEDKNFYVHHGVDPVSILRAALTDIGRWRNHRRPIGASTITQQVAKNMLLSNEVTIARKIKEILLATKIDSTLPKDRILELYLNEIYLGAGAYGVAAAAETYFDKSLDQLSLGEAAFLGGLPKAPNNYNPERFPQAANARRDWVLDRMAEDGYVSTAEAAAAKAEPLVMRHREEAEFVDAPYFSEEVRRELLARYGEKMLYEGGLSVRTSLDPAMQAAADKQLRAGLIAYDRAKGGWRGAIGHIEPGPGWPRRLARQGLPAGADAVGWQLAAVLHTEDGGAEIGLKGGATGFIPFAEMRWARPLRADSSLGSYPRRPADVVKPGDLVLVDKLAGNTAEPILEARRGRVSVVGTTTHDLYNLCQIPEVSGALVAIDPHTGRVLAMTGGFSFEMSQFNRATQAERQEGSAIKPFVYLTALEHGFTPSTLILDAPIALSQGPGLPLWEPHNYEDRFGGPTTMLVGLEHSINVMSARTTAIIGLDALAKTVESFGIMDKMPHDFSMSLGAGPTTPLRLTAAYAMLVNGGKRLTPTLIDRVQDRNGETIYRADNRPCLKCNNVDWHGQPVPAIPDTRQQIADPAAAFQVVQMMEGVVERGTGRAVAALGRPVAGKTGTTSDWTDAWFEGFTPDLAAGVFVGYDQPVSLGDGEQAAVVAAPIFRDFMAAALQDQPASEFRIPPGVQLYRVDPETGLPPSSGEPAIWQAFKDGTDPMSNRDLGLQSAPQELAGAANSSAEKPPAPDEADDQSPVAASPDEPSAEGPVAGAAQLPPPPPPEGAALPPQFPSPETPPPPPNWVPMPAPPPGVAMQAAEAPAGRPPAMDAPGSMLFQVPPGVPAAPPLPPPGATTSMPWRQAPANGTGGLY